MPRSFFNLDADASPATVTGRDVFQVIREQIFAAAALGFMHGALTSAITGRDVVPGSFVAEQREFFAENEMWAAGWDYPRENSDNRAPRAVEAVIITGALMDGAMEDVKSWARDQRRLYNNEKLQDMVLRYLVDAYDLGADESDPFQLMHTLGRNFNHTI